MRIGGPIEESLRVAIQLGKIHDWTVAQLIIILLLLYRLSVIASKLYHIVFDITVVYYVSYMLLGWLLCFKHSLRIIDGCSSLDRTSILNIIMILSWDHAPV